MKRLSLFDQLQIRFPINERTNVRRSAEAGAAAASMSKSGFGGSLLTNMGNMSADTEVHSMLTPWSPGKYISKDIVAKVGRVHFCNQHRKKCRFLAAILLQFPYFRRLLVTVAIFGIRLAFDLNQSKLFCTIKMLGDLFHSNPEG